MSREVPTNIGELSVYAMQQALDKVDAALKDAPQEVRDAVSVIRLVESMPRRSPWWGIHTWAGRADDQSAPLGVLLQNIATTLEYVDRIDEDPVSKDNALSLARSDAARLRSMLDRAKREYDEHLDHLLDPEDWERDRARRRLEAEEAAHMMRLATEYRRGGK